MSMTIDEFETKRWRNEKGQLHREDGPAVEWTSGDREWWLNGKRHREDGPAVEWSGGYKAWWLNGKRHREDGPAIEWSDGGKEYCLNGNYITQEEHIAQRAKISHDNTERYDVIFRITGNYVVRGIVANSKDDAINNATDLMWLGNKDAYFVDLDKEVEAVKVD